MAINDNSLNDEIDLHSFVLILSRRKKFILGSIALGLIVAVIVVVAANHYTPAIYEANSKIRLGILYWGKLVPGYSTHPSLTEEEIGKWLLNPGSLSSVIEKFGLETTSRKLRKMVSMTIQKDNDADFLKISVNYPKEKETAKICQELHNSALRYIEEKLWFVRGELKFLEEKKRILNKAIAEGKDSLSRLSKSAPRDSSTQTIHDEILVKLILSQYQNILDEAKWSELRLKEVLQVGQPQEVQIPIVSPAMKQKRLELVPMLATLGALGFLGGVFGAFLKEKMLEKRTKH